MHTVKEATDEVKRTNENRNGKTRNRNEA